MNRQRELTALNRQGKQQRKEDVPSVEIIYPVFTGMPGGVTVGDSGLCCCVPCLLSAINSPCLLILHRCSRPVSEYLKSSIEPDDIAV